MSNDVVNNQGPTSNAIAGVRRWSTSLDAGASLLPLYCGAPCDSHRFRTALMSTGRHQAGVEWQSARAVTAIDVYAPEEADLAELEVLGLASGRLIELTASRPLEGGLRLVESRSLKVLSRRRGEFLDTPQRAHQHRV